MSQKELAEAAGLTPASVSRYVNGERLPWPATIAEYREQFLGKVGHRATISGHMGSKRGTAANLAKVRCTLAQVFDSFAIFTVNDGRHTQPGRRRTLCVDFASVHSGDTVVEWL